MSVHRNLARRLDALPGLGPERKRLFLGDLGELLNRSAYGSEHDFQFHDPVVARLPIVLDAATIDRIARAVVGCLLRRDEPSDVRVALVWVLGKLHHPLALAAVIRMVRDEADAPPELIRQCAFSFHAIWDRAAARQAPDGEAPAAVFRARGIPWDDREGTVAINDL